MVSIIIFTKKNKPILEIWIALLIEDMEKVYNKLKLFNCISKYDPIKINKFNKLPKFNEA